MLAPCITPRQPPAPTTLPAFADLLGRIDAAAAALPRSPEAALRELRAARALLVAGNVRGRGGPDRGNCDVHLTAREQQVLVLLAQGDRNKEIALRLRLRERTVKFHVANVLQKLGVQSRTEALRRALELGLVA